MRYFNRLLNYINKFSISKRLKSISSEKNDFFSFPLADIGEGITEVELIQWYTSPGSEIKEFEKICEVMSDKANVEITSPYDAIIKELHCEIGKMAKVGETLVTMKLNNSSETCEFKKPTVDHSETKGTFRPIFETKSCNLTKKNVTSPATRRIAKENNIDMSLILGTGPAKRILKKDVINYLKKKIPDNKKYSKLTTSFPTSQTSLVISSECKDKIVPITGVKRFMVKKMNEASKIACFGYGDDIKMTRLIEIRNRLKSLANKEKIKLSYMPFIIKATSLCLLEFPYVNAHVNKECTEIIYRKNHNVGLAVDSFQGLVVPNVKHIQKKTIFQIAKDMNNLIERVKKQTITQQDLKEGTITLSNIGSIGGTVCRPVIFSPEVIIAALGKISTLPVYEKKQLFEQQFMHCQWTADHRVLDGANVARFCNKWKSYIEEPELMLLNLR